MVLKSSLCENYPKVAGSFLVGDSMAIIESRSKMNPTTLEEK